MIKIINNFFDDKLFVNIKNHVMTKLYFTPQYFKNTKEKNEENYYGSRFLLKEDPNLLDIFKTTAEKKFNIKIKKLHYDTGIDIRNLNKFKPHIDDGMINIMTMLSGPTAVTNGTVFYTDGELDIHVGFKENRSILFPSNWYHSNHASNISNLKRYTSTLFVTDYSEE
tara:strand:+ start:5188 stop:5691 length:504 start_codon:yes stop_codon:yes gene_type:complete